MEYILQDIKLLKFTIVTQKPEGEVGLAEAVLRASYAAKPAMTLFWSWHVPAVKRKLRLLVYEEHELQVVVIRKRDGKRSWYERKKRVEDEERAGDEEAERENMPPQRLQLHPCKASMNRSW